MNLPDAELQIMLTDPKKRGEAYSRIVRRYQERIYWHIRKMVLLHDDANDVMQNTFLKAWNGLDGFRGDSQISTWLYRIATNETLTFLANKKAKAGIQLDAADLNIANTLRADAYFDGNEVQAQLQQAISLLPEKQRLVFNMRYYDEMTYEEMEQILGTSVGALKASFHHAVKKIKKHFELEQN
jgi:RNA polymerase sigma-70 factor (ECF subfamily)